MQLQQQPDKETAVQKLHYSFTPDRVQAVSALVKRSALALSVFLTLKIGISRAAITVTPDGRPKPKKHLPTRLKKLLTQRLRPLSMTKH